MAAMQLTNNVAALPATGISAIPLSSTTSSSSSARVRSSTRIAIQRLVARAESNPASGGTTDKAGYAQTNAGGSGAPNPSSFANDVVEGVADKVEDAQQSAANLGSETQENLNNVRLDAKEGLDDIVDSGKEIVDRATSSNPGH